MKRYYPALFVLALGFQMFFFNSCTQKKVIVKKAPKSINFIVNTNQSLTNVLDKASVSDKIVFVDFTADWCLPCQLMEEEVFNQSAVYSLFNSNFINYKVNVEESNGANLKLMFDASQLPTYLFLDKKGRIIRKIVGSVSQTELINQAKEVLSI